VKVTEGRRNKEMMVISKSFEGILEDEMNVVPLIELEGVILRFGEMTEGDDDTVVLTVMRINEDDGVNEYDCEIGSTVIDKEEEGEIDLLESNCFENEIFDAASREMIEDDCDSVSFDITRINEDDGINENDSENDCEIGLAVTDKEDEEEDGEEREIDLLE
jgi:hypothetical protein